MKMKSRFMVFLFTLIAAVIGCSAGVSAMPMQYNITDCRNKETIYVAGDRLYNNMEIHLHPVYIYIDDVLKGKMDFREYYTFDCSEDVYLKYYDWGNSNNNYQCYFKSYPKDEQPAPEVSVNDKEYDGTPVSFSIGSGIGTLTYYFVGRDGTSYPKTVTPPSKVGDFSLNVTYSGDNTRKAWSNTYDFTITGSGQADETKVLLTIPEHVSVVYTDSSLGMIESGKSVRVFTDTPLLLSSSRYFFIKINEQTYAATNEGSSTEDHYTLELINGISEDAIIYEQTVIREEYFRVGDTITLRADEFVLVNGKPKKWSEMTGVNSDGLISRKLYYDNNSIAFGDLDVSTGEYNSTSPIPIGKYISRGTGTSSDPYYIIDNKIYRVLSYYKLVEYHCGDQVENIGRNLIVDVQIEEPLTSGTNTDNCRRILSYSLPFTVEYKQTNALGITSTDTIVSTYKDGKYIAVVPRHPNSIISNAIISDINIDEANLRYILSFNSNGGEIIENQMILLGDVPQKPLDPVREGYTFVGWYRDAELIDEFDFEAPLNQNTTIYAKWSRITPQSYSVKYNWNGENCTATIVYADGTTDTVEMIKQTNGTWIGSYNGESITTKRIGIKNAEKSFIRQSNNDGTSTDNVVITISVGLDPNEGVSIKRIGFVVQIGDTKKTFAKAINAYASNYKLTLKIPSDKKITYNYFYEKNDGSDPVACEAVTEYPLV